MAGTIPEPQLEGAPQISKNIFLPMRKEKDICALFNFGVAQENISDNHKITIII